MKGDLEGHSSKPQLNEPSAQREWPAITTANQNNHTVRTRDWRYIRYRNGKEELYDHRNDPFEWNNLALNPEFDGKKAELREKLLGMIYGND